MEELTQQRISEFIDDVKSVAPEQAEIIGLIRSLFNEISCELSEDIKYGGLVFLKASFLIGGIFPYKNHISIEFSNGADFSDPQGLLEGKGKRRRHVKIHNHQDVDRKNAAFFIRQSVIRQSVGMS
jgi:hypothetical protein